MVEFCPNRQRKTNMKKTGLHADIARVGSIEYQRHWCVHGTADQYLLLNELLETTSYAAMHKATHPALSKDLTEQERDALLRFHAQVDELAEQIPWQDANVSIEEIVEHSEAMREIRQAAVDCLRDIDVVVSREEIMRG